MDASLFIARRLRFRGRMAMISIAISFLVMIIAVSVSSGFRREIAAGLSSISGDVQLLPPDMNVFDESSPIEWNASYLPAVRDLKEVEEVVPVVYRAGIVKSGEDIHGIIVKGLPSEHSPLADAPDSVSLPVSVPERLSEITGLSAGDRMLCYFIGDKVRVRNFNIVSVHNALVEADDRLVVYAALSDMQKLNRWSDNQVSAVEVRLASDAGDREEINEAASLIGAMVSGYSAESESPVISVSSVSRYPQLFDWLGLIDFNVLFILVLMTVVAGFNMISGLLILLFENISTIGLMKSLGMTDRAIAKSFLAVSANLVLKGMAVGNALAVLFCVVQSATHFLKLNPENYFVSFVPVELDIAMILLADIISFVVIMLLLLIPCLFVAKVDPAETVRVK